MKAIRHSSPDPLCTIGLPRGHIVKQRMPGLEAWKDQNGQVRSLHAEHSWPGGTFRLAGYPKTI